MLIRSVNMNLSIRLKFISKQTDFWKKQNNAEMAWRSGGLLEHQANNRFEFELVRSCGGGV